MAANLAGMFSQLNNAIGNSPVGAANKLLDQTSQSFGGAMGHATGRDPMSFMNDGGRTREVARQAGQLDLSTVAGLTQAAALAQQAGKPADAVRYLKLRDEMQAKAAAENAAQLDAGNAGIQEQAVKTRQMAQRKMGASMARKRGDITEAEAIENQLLDPQVYITGITGTDKNPRIGSSSQTVQDSEGNYFNVTRLTDRKTGKSTNEYSPLSLDGAQSPQGRVTPVSSTSGVNAWGNLDVEKKGRWDLKREDAIAAMPQMLESKMEAQRALDLLEQTSTGGAMAQITALQNFFNVGDTTSEAELSNIMGDYVLNEIKKLGVNPTDADLRFLMDSVQNMKKGDKANTALFQKAMRTLERTITANQYLLDNPSATQADYIENYKKLYEVAPASEGGSGGGAGAAIDFSQLKKG